MSRIHSPLLYAAVFAIAILGVTGLHAQPVLPSKREVAGLSIYRDMNNKNLYYYAPGKLRMATDKFGKPGFQLVQLRYTGTGASGDQGEKRFLNIVQVIIWMEQFEGSQLKAAQNQLGGQKIILQPMPVRNIDAFLVMPMGDTGNCYISVGKAGGLEDADADGGYWIEKVFTVRLENHEAQLLWDQVEKGRLAVSLAYAFYADAISDPEGSYKVSGDFKEVGELKEELDQLVQPDSTPVLQAFSSGAFPIEVDPKVWPDLMRKVDINDEAPPAWGVLEVRCYDFSNDLRPDLGMKAIEIEASGVTDEPVRITGKRFLSSRPDQTCLQIKFPYAVKLSKPYRYRILEYTAEGERREFPWITRNSWAGVLDITTPHDQIHLTLRELEVELAPDVFERTHASEIQVDFTFMQENEIKVLKLVWKPNDGQMLKTLRFYSDKGQFVQYCVKWIIGEERYRSVKRGVGVDDYVYVDFK
ncbi:MAG: hypothetical protein WA004_15205 [Saprospiraceae bacterium]